jgi:hypothetical protein
MTATPIHHWTFDNISGSTVIDEISGGVVLSFSGRSVGAGWDGNAMIGGVSSSLLTLAASTPFKAIFCRIKRLDTSKYANICSNSAVYVCTIGINPTALGNNIYGWDGSALNNSNLTVGNTNYHSFGITEGSDANHHWFWLDGVKSSSEIETNLNGELQNFGRGDGYALQENVTIDNIQWYDRIPTNDEIAYLVAATSQDVTLPTSSSLLFSALHQPYGDVPLLAASLQQPYSLLIETWLQQIYGDVPELSTALHQPYGDAAVLQRTILQPWADALQVEASLEQPFSFPETLQAAIEQRWGIVAAVLEKSCEQLFHLEQNTTLFAGLCQPFAMLGEAARLHSLTTKLYVGGVRIPYVSLEWQATDSEFFWYCAFSVKSRAVADLCADGAAIRIEHMGEEYHLKCYGGWLLDRRHAEETYRVEGYSRTRGLDEATPLRQDFAGGLASQIVADLAAPFSIAVNWKMVDGWIADGKLTANDETPMTIIRNIVADMGGIVQTTPAGDLLIIAEEEIAIPDYPTAPVSATINASLERISTSEQRDEQKGYNKFVVSDQAAAGGQFALDYVEIDAGTRELRLFVVPLEGRQFTLTSSGGSEVTIEPVGVVDLAIVDELVEFVAGSGRTQRPIHGISAQAWQRDNLGAITATEDGVLTAATTGYSLLKISYTSRYHKWLGRDSNIESVQFVATEVLP